MNAGRRGWLDNQLRAVIVNFDHTSFIEGQSDGSVGRPSYVDDGSVQESENKVVRFQNRPAELYDVRPQGLGDP
jgi:hypothetical protein